MPYDRYNFDRNNQARESLESTIAPDYISSAERLQATGDFKDLVSDTLTKFEDKKYVFTNEENVLGRLDQDDKTHISVCVRRHTYDDGSVNYGVGLQEISDGYGGDMYNYRLNDDGILVRQARDVRRELMLRDRYYYDDFVPLPIQGHSGNFVDLGPRNISEHAVGPDEVSKLAILLQEMTLDK